MTDDAVGAREGSLQVLRSYQPLDPWGLRDLSTLAGTLLEATSVVPVSRSAKARPSERAIRYYVSQGLVDPPDGRGAAAVYRYRHLVQVLAIKLRQMEGASLEDIGKELEAHEPDHMERWVAAALDPGLPSPAELGPLGAGTPSAGAGRPQPAPEEGEGAVTAMHGRSMLMRRFQVAPGAELVLDATHPLFKRAAADENVIRVVATALDTLARGPAKE